MENDGCILLHAIMENMQWVVCEMQHNIGAIPSNKEDGINEEWMRFISHECDITFDTEKLRFLPDVSWAWIPLTTATPDSILFALQNILANGQMRDNVINRRYQIMFRKYQFVGGFKRSHCNFLICLFDNLCKLSKRGSFIRAQLLDREEFALQGLCSISSGVTSHAACRRALVGQRMTAHRDRAAARSNESSFISVLLRAERIRISRILQALWPDIVGAKPIVLLEPR